MVEKTHPYCDRFANAIDYVNANPTAFTGAYFEFNKILRATCSMLDELLHDVYNIIIY